MTLSFAERTVPPQGETTYSFAVFAGPKVITDLEQVAPGGEDVELDQAVDVTLALLSRPILSLLKFFHGFAHNWGLAIILLTLFIKLVTFYPTQKSLLSAKKMQKLAPKMNAIRKKYENDRQRQSVETMNLYKAHGVSPFGGCLPSLIQMPIWIALYSTLNYAVELYRAPFFGHIHDLTAKDPFYITPLLMGGRDVPADADVAVRRRQPAAGDDVDDDADHVHRLLAVPAVGSGGLHADQLPHRHPAAALRQPPRPQRRDCLGAARDVRLPFGKIAEANAGDHEVLHRQCRPR